MHYQNPDSPVRCSPVQHVGVSVPASFAVLDSLTGGLGEDDALQLSELQDLQIVNNHSDIRHHIVGQISRQHLAIWLEREQGYVEIQFLSLIAHNWFITTHYTFMSTFIDQSFQKIPKD